LLSSSSLVGQGPDIFLVFFPKTAIYVLLLNVKKNLLSTSYILALYRQTLSLWVLVLLLGIYPSKLGPVQNIIGITDISGNLRVFLLPHEHVISDPRNVSLTVVVTFAW